MVAVIHTGRTLRAVLNYNETKLIQKQADCILAANYLKEVADLNFHQKLIRLTRQAALNQNVKRNSLHISLNFDPSEKLGSEKLKDIAESYMTKIGFGEQPYLVYTHHDAGHPHLHIITTNIRDSGKRIELHNIGRNQSEKARKEIEQEFNLIKAEKHQLKHANSIKPIQTKKIEYGKSETRRAIANVLGQVINSYKYTSLPELNAVLGLYNISVSRGIEGSRTFEKRGLIYRILDEKGSMVGIPIKASLLPEKPILTLLEEKFKENRKLRLPQKERIKSIIEMSLQQKNQSLPDLVQSLKKEQIDAVIRKNREGLTYGITFIDHRYKTVFKGSDLGKEYSAMNILFRLNLPLTNIQSFQKQNQQFQNTKILDDLIAPEKASDYLPYELIQSRRRRKRHSHNN